VGEREAVKRYLDQLEAADNEDEVVIDNGAVGEALKKLQQNPEPEARFMRTTAGQVPAYNVQTAVDTQHALIVVQQVTTEASDNRSLLPMAEAAQAAIGNPPLLNVVADAGYSNGEQAEACEAKGILPHVPANRAVNNQGDGTLFDRSQFHYDETTDTFRCPAGQKLPRKQLQRRRKRVVYAAAPEVCGACPMKARCTTSPQRFLHRHLYDDVLQRMQLRATAEAMRLRRSTVEHPFATLKYRIFGHPRFLLRGVGGAQTEISLAVIVYNLKRMINVLGGSRLQAALVG
jgi:transposase